MALPDFDLFRQHVSRVFRIEDVTAGNPKEWIARYRGHLLTEDTVAAYDQLADALRPYNITPLFRKEKDDKQVIFLVPTPTPPRSSSRVYVNIILFIVTVFSVMLMGVDVPPEAVPAGGSVSIPLLLRYIFTGWPFALSMLGILFTHEMGHYIACRYYKVPATLPYFLPAPLLSPLGTLGAFIIMRGIPKNKRVLFDVGVAGPLAGLVIASAMCMPCSLTRRLATTRRRGCASSSSSATGTASSPGAAAAPGPATSTTSSRTSHPTRADPPARPPPEPRPAVPATSPGQDLHRLDLPTQPRRHLHLDLTPPGALPRHRHRHPRFHRPLNPDSPRPNRARRRGHAIDHMRAGSPRGSLRVARTRAAGVASSISPRRRRRRRARAGASAARRGRWCGTGRRRCGTRAGRRSVHVRPRAPRPRARTCRRPATGTGPASLRRTARGC